jgi:hypothetical protein
VTSCDLALVLRYRKAVTYGFHTLLGALEEHTSAVRYEVSFATTVDETVATIEAALRTASRVLVLWSFYSPDAAALAVELGPGRFAAGTARRRGCARDGGAGADPRRGLGRRGGR